MNMRDSDHSARPPEEPRTVGVDLSRYDRRGYSPGAGLGRRFIWYTINAVIFDSWLLPWSSLKRWLLRAFGARVGVGVVIKPRVNIKYPWHLDIGDQVWIGEGVWIDNLVRVSIGPDVCLSQGAYLLTGNHDYRDPRFGLMTAPIDIERGAWIGSKAIVGPGIRMGPESVLLAGSVLASDAEASGVYRGNPATRVRSRTGP